MKKILGLITLGFILSSCATPPAIDISDTAKKSIHKGTYEKRLGEINSARLMLLEPGMSKSQVLEIMGTIGSQCQLNPLSISLFSIKEDNITLIYYYTYSATDRFLTCNSENSDLPRNMRSVKEANITALVLVNGKLIGWGEEALRRAQDKYDITIKKDFDIKVE